MSTISQKQYVKANLRLEELLKKVNDDTPKSSPILHELIEVSDIIESYEEIHFPIGLPSRKEIIELRMFEMDLKRKDLATLLNTSPSIISDYLDGNREINSKLAEALCQKLNIDSDVIFQDTTNKNISLRFQDRY